MMCCNCPERRWQKFKDSAKLTGGILLIIIVCSVLILMPVFFGLLWYHFIHEPISSAIVGVVCGLIADACILAIGSLITG